MSVGQLQLQYTMYHIVAHLVMMSEDVLQSAINCKLHQTFMKLTTPCRAQFTVQYGSRHIGRRAGWEDVVKIKELGPIMEEGSRDVQNITSYTLHAL